MKKAVVLLSGGIDSSTCLALAKADGFACYALSIQYDQRHGSEINFARKIAKEFEVIEHKIININMSAIGGSALTDMKIKVPEKTTGGIPVTYVPARNTIFLALALGYAEVIAAQDIFIGVNVVDYSGYPDCRKEFINAFTNMANLATRAGVEGRVTRINTPLINLGKDEIIRSGIKAGVNYALTISCYVADEHGAACGTCDACRIRAAGFAAAGVPDPTIYKK